MTTWLTVAGVCYAIGFLLWAAVGSFLCMTLREYWPDLYRRAGSPTGADFWWRRRFPNSFDEFTLTRRFRKVPIDNTDILWQLEVACFLRWVQIAAFTAFVVLLFVSIGRPI